MQAELEKFNSLDHTYTAQQSLILHVVVCTRSNTPVWSQRACLSELGADMLLFLLKEANMSENHFKSISYVSAVRGIHYVLSYRQFMKLPATSWFWQYLEVEDWLKREVGYRRWQGQEKCQQEKDATAPLEWRTPSNDPYTQLMCSYLVQHWDIN